jgi:hypothetical protein
VIGSAIRRWETVRWNIARKIRLELWILPFDIESFSILQHPTLEFDGVSIRVGCMIRWPGLDFLIKRTS